jgi:hypothetical protein
MFISGVNDTGHKLFGGVNDSADKFITGVNDTGDYYFSHFSPVSLIPVRNIQKA